MLVEGQWVGEMCPLKPNLHFVEGLLRTLLLYSNNEDLVAFPAFSGLAVSSRTSQLVSPRLSFLSCESGLGDHTDLLWWTKSWHWDSFYARGLIPCLQMMITRGVWTVVDVWLLLLPSCSSWAWFLPALSGCLFSLFPFFLDAAIPLLSSSQTALLLPYPIYNLSKAASPIKLLLLALTHIQPPIDIFGSAPVSLWLWMYRAEFINPHF
jgi:hypothetical protein